MNILERIEELRKAKGWSVNYLAKQAGCKYSTINNLFIRNNLPTLLTLEKICTAFGISLSEFFSESDDVTLSDSQREILRIWSELPFEQMKNLLPLLIDSMKPLK